MDRNHAGVRYRTDHTFDNVGGCDTITLYKGEDGNLEPVADITYWDADGQFTFNAMTNEIPLDILERLIAETHEKIPIR